MINLLTEIFRPAGKKNEVVDVLKTLFEFRFEMLPLRFGVVTARTDRGKRLKLPSSVTRFPSFLSPAASPSLPPCSDYTQ